MEEKEQTQENTDKLSEIDLIFNTLDQNDPCVETSKQYLELQSETVYNCSLCNVTILRPLVSHERRFNIWLHIHDSAHKSLLPNYNIMFKHAQELLNKVSEKEPNFRGVNCFELGPVYYLIQCRICQCVIKCTESRIRIHLQSINHREKYLDILENCKSGSLVDCKDDTLEDCKFDILKDYEDGNLADCDYYSHEGCKDDTLQGCKDSTLEGCKDDCLQNCKDGILEGCEDKNLQDCQGYTIQDCKDGTVEGYEGKHLQDCQDYTLQDCEDSTLEGCEGKSLQDCQGYTLQDCKDGTVEVCEDDSLQNFKDGTLEDCEDKNLQDCEDDKLQNCKDVDLEGCEDKNLHDFKDGPIEGCEYENLQHCKDDSNKKLMDLEEDKQFNAIFKCLPEELKEDKKYIIAGYNPGYLICSLCSDCIVSSPFYLKSHLTNFWHNTNKEIPFHLPDYSRKIPNPVKLTSIRALTVCAMKFFMLVVKTNDSVIKNNINKYVSKQLGINNRFYCQLCNKKFCKTEPRKLYELIALHFEEKEHLKNKFSPLRFKLKEDRFLMFDNIPIEVYEDIRLFKVLPTQDIKLSSDHEVFCSVCNDSLPLDLTVFVDHTQSKQHKKMKIMFKMSKKLNNVSTTIDEVFVKISSKNENIKSMRQHFSPNSDCSKIVCKLCNSTVGNATDTVIDLEKIFVRHLTNKGHMLYLQEVSSSGPNSNIVSNSMLEKMFKTIPNFDKSNKSIITISKKPGHLKCKVCSSRFLADINSFKDHIEKKNHKKHVKMWKDNN